MKRNNKLLYERIMRNISREVKRTLNEIIIDPYDKNYIGQHIRQRGVYTASLTEKTPWHVAVKHAFKDNAFFCDCTVVEADGKDGFFVISKVMIEPGTNVYNWAKTFIDNPQYIQISHEDNVWSAMLCSDISELTEYLGETTRGCSKLPEIILEHF